MPYKVFSYTVVICVVTQCVFRSIERDDPNDSCKNKLLQSFLTSEKSEGKNGFWVLFRGDHASHRSWLTGDNNSVKTFGSIPSQRHKCFFPFLHFFFPELRNQHRWQRTCWKSKLRSLHNWAPLKKGLVWGLKCSALLCSPIWRPSRWVSKNQTAVF